jgi:membrane-associated HD superfamily phosphohydrolase
VADRDIKATHEFLVEDSELSEMNRQDAVRNVLSVYDFDNTATNAASRIREAFSIGREYLTGSTKAAVVPEKTSSETKAVSEEQTISLDSFKNQFFGILDIAVMDGVFDVLMKSNFPARAENATIKLVADVLKKGVVGNKMMLMAQSGKGITLHRIQTEMETSVTDLNRFYDLKGARDYIEGQSDKLNSLNSPDLAEASLKLAAALVKPNLTFNKRETELRKDLARKSVTPFYFKVKKGEMLVREGERITPEHLLKVSEQQKFLKQNETLGRVPAMAVMIFLLLSAMHLVGFVIGKSDS